MQNTWMRGVAATGLAWVALVGVAGAQQRAEEARDRRDREAPAAPAASGPIDDMRDLRETGRLFFGLADLNNDRRISQKEAVDAGNLLVGGFFFRADADGNGTLTRDEARQARESLFQQRPALRMVWERSRRANNNAEGGQGAGGSPVQNLADLLDDNNDRRLQATELRAMVERAVSDLYEAADTDRDGQMSPGEINAGVTSLARAAGRAAFEAADADKNNTLSQDEFERALAAPVRMLFRAADRDGDGQLSVDEAQAAQRTIMSQVRGRAPQDADRDDDAPARDRDRQGDRPRRDRQDGQGSGSPASAQPRSSR